MNGKERNEVSHEDLCALVLGELEGAERERVERAVAASPELTAERERLSATIGIVRGALGSPAQLSGEQRAGLARAASGAAASSDDAWRPLMRAAAVLLVVAGGFVVAREVTDRGSEPAPDGEELARGDSTKRTRFSELLLEPVFADPAEAPPQVLFSVTRELNELEEHHRSQFGAVAQGERPKATEVKSDYARSHGGTYRGPGDAVPPSEGALAQGELAKLEVGRVQDSVALRERRAGYIAPTDGSQPPGTGGDDWFMGFGQEGGTSADSRTSQELKELRAIGYSGGTPAPEPAVVVWPGGGGGPASPGNVGPATPGPFTPAGPRFPATGGGPPHERVARAETGVPSLKSKSDSGEVSWGREALRDADKNEEIVEELHDDENGRSVRGSDLFLHDRRDDTRTPRELSAAELDELVSARLTRILDDCRPRPSERPRDMFFRYWGDNPFVLTQLDALSTFSVDVDTASYALARRYLREGHLPEKAQVRTEEFVNYFAPDVAPPTEGTFAIHTDLVPTRFGNADAQRWMLRVVVRGKDVSREERQPLDLVFVVDVSGSMREGNRLELVKHGLRLLASQLDARDSIAIVAFSREARQVMPLTSAAQRAELETALHGLEPGGGTNTESGLVMGYDIASRALDPNRVTRVVLLSDGVANIGETSHAVLTERVKSQRERGVYLNTIGVGMNNHNDVLLEQLAGAGDGICNYIDDEKEARRALVENFTGALVPIARDVKIQLEFDPQNVKRFRQLGYENRAIAHQDFRNDAVDAGEVGAGHQVVALYELELESRDAEAVLGTVRLRWKQPTSGGRDPLEDDATEVEHTISVNNATSWDGASLGYRRAVVVAQFAELLRRSVHAREVSLDEVIAESRKVAVQANDSELIELVSLMEKSRQLVLATRAHYGEFERCLDLYRAHCILRAELEVLGHDAHHERIRELERKNAELRRLLADLLRNKLLDEPQRR